MMIKIFGAPGVSFHTRPCKGELDFTERLKHYNCAIKFSYIALSFVFYVLRWKKIYMTKRKSEIRGFLKRSQLYLNGFKQ